MGNSKDGNLSTVQIPSDSILRILGPWIYEASIKSDKGYMTSWDKSKI